MSYKTHKRRPTSIAADEILRSSLSNMYIAADGQLLQSSMVKEGSPSRKRLTGSASQVRFDLPEISYEKEESSSEVDSFTSEAKEDVSEYSNDSFDHKYLFNTESHEVMRGRTLNRDDRCEVSQCMRDLVSTSPQRNKLFIRPNSKLNSQLIPIPVEVRLPPVLSREGKRMNRPTSLVFNGVDYEPLEMNFINNQYLQQKVKTPRPQNIQPTQSQPKITIPELDARVRTHLRPQSFSFDNEKEIANPSPTAKRLNNELNRTFSFPPRSQVTKPLQKPEVADENLLPKDLPPLPSHKSLLPVIEICNPTTTGLRIFHEGEILPPERPQNPLGRFATHSSQSASPTCRGVVYTHCHRRSKSTTEPLDDALSVEGSTLNETSKTPPPPLMRNPSGTIAFGDPSSPPQSPQMYGLWKPLLNTREESPASSQYSLPNSIQESAQSLQRSESSVYSVLTPGQYKEDQGSVHGSAQSSRASAEETVSTSESTQLIDLRDLIISAGGHLTLTDRQIEEMDRTIASQSHIYDEPVPQIILDEITSKIDTVDRSSFEGDSQPLNSFMQPHQIYAKDTIESDNIRSISRSMNLRLRKSPLLSESSYESEISEPFSHASTANTADTVFSSRLQASQLGHLNIISKDKGLAPEYIRQKSYTVMKEMDNGEFQETIVLDSDDEHTNNELIITKVKKIGNPSPTTSRFSFEAIASEALAQYHLSPEKPVRRYTSKRKSVMELCDDAMKNTKEVMDHLKRQRTILIRRRNELMKQQKKDIDKLKAIKELQDKVKRVHDREQSLQKELTKQRNMDHYYDYANSESYDFETFMRSKSNISLASLELSQI